MQEVAEYRVYGEEWFSREGDRVVLYGSRCSECGMHWFPKKTICPNCLSEKIEQKVLSQEGTVYSCTRLHVSSKRFTPPLWIAYIDFPEGVRICGQVEAENLRIGDKVRPIYGKIRNDFDGVTVYSYKFTIVKKDVTK